MTPSVLLAPADRLDVPHLQWPSRPFSWPLPRESSLTCDATIIFSLYGAIISFSISDHQQYCFLSLARPHSSPSHLDINHFCTPDMASQPPAQSNSDVLPKCSSSDISNLRPSFGCPRVGHGRAVSGTISISAPLPSDSKLALGESADPHPTNPSGLSLESHSRYRSDSLHRSTTDLNSSLQPVQALSHRLSLQTSLRHNHVKPDLILSKPLRSKYSHQFRPLNRSPNRDITLELRQQGQSVSSCNPLAVYKHPHVTLSLSLQSSLFMAGDIIPGFIWVSPTVRARDPALALLKLSGIQVEFWGFEEASGRGRSVFVSVKTQPTFDSCQEPSCLRQNSLSIRHTAGFPFELRIPPDVVLPSFASKFARVRYFMTCSATIQDSGRYCLLQTPYEVSVFPLLDPDIAWTPFSQPLTASDVWHDPSSPSQTVQLTVGLFRPVWISGTSLFLDVNVANQYHRPTRKLEIQLEREVVRYRSIDQGPDCLSNSQPDSFVEATVICRSVLKAPIPGGRTPLWTGTQPCFSFQRSFELEIPRDHITIQGSLFGVGYSVNVIIHFGDAKRTHSMKVSVPVVLVHMNSLHGSSRRSGLHASIGDLEPTRTPFSPTKSHLEKPRRAPLPDSLPGHDCQTDELVKIGKELNRSPRKYGRPLSRTFHDGSQSSEQEKLVGADEAGRDFPPLSALDLLPRPSSTHKAGVRSGDPQRCRSGADTNSNNSAERLRGSPVRRFDLSIKLDNPMSPRLEGTRGGELPRYTYIPPPSRPPPRPKKSLLTLVVEQSTLGDGGAMGGCLHQAGECASPGTRWNQSVEARPSGRPLRQFGSVDAIRCDPMSESRGRRHHRDRSLASDARVLSSRMMSFTSRALRQARSSLSFHTSESSNESDIRH